MGLVVQELQKQGTAGQERRHACMCGSEEPNHAAHDQLGILQLTSGTHQQTQALKSDLRLCRWLWRQGKRGG